MIDEFKYQCLHCSKKFKIPTRFAGKLIKCPFCAGFLSLPKVVISAENYDMLSATRRTVLPRRKRFPTGLCIKWIIIFIIAYSSYQGFVYYKKQNSKDIEVLMAEYELFPDRRDYFFIKKNFTRRDAKVLWKYVKSSEKQMRVLVAECFAKIPYSDQVYEELQQYLQDDVVVEVRIATANTCGEIKRKKIIELLILQLEKEENDKVKGAIGQALRNITGARGNAVNQQRWEMWWRNNIQSYPD